MPKPLPAPPSTPQPSPTLARPDGRALCGIAVLCVLALLSGPMPAHAAQPCERGHNECASAKPAPPHHRKAHHPAQAQPTDPDVFVARPVSADPPKKTKAPAQRAKRAQP